MRVDEYNNFKLRILAKANGRNIHDIPPLLYYMGDAVKCLQKNIDVEFSTAIIEMCKRNINTLLNK